MWDFLIFQIHIIDTGITKTGLGKIVFKYQERGKMPSKPFLLIQRIDCDHQLIFKDHKTTKRNCFPMANMLREKRERLSSFLTVSLPSSNT